MTPAQAPPKRLGSRENPSTEMGFSPASRRRGGQPIALPASLQAVHTGYIAALASAPLAAETRRTYASKVRGYLAWLGTADLPGDPLTESDARDRAAHDYRTHLLTVVGRAPTTVNNALAAVDDFYTRRGLGPAKAARADQPATTAPRALSPRAQLAWLRAVDDQPLPRDRALAFLPFYAGTRIAETVALDIDDLHLTARRGILHVRDTSGRIRDIPLHPRLRVELKSWLAQRTTWPGAQTNPALFLNHRGGRLTVRGARDVIARISHAAGLDALATAQILRHTFAATLARGGTNLVTVAELLGHARLDTTRVYTQSTAKDRAKALALLPAGY